MIRLALIATLLTGCNAFGLTHAQRQHVNAGLIAGGFTYTVTENPHYACLVSATAGAAKELYDATGRGHASVSDVAYTAVPSCLLFYLVDWSIR